VRDMRRMRIIAVCAAVAVGSSCGVQSPEDALNPAASAGSEVPAPYVPDGPVATDGPNDEAFRPKARPAPTEEQIRRRYGRTPDMRELFERANELPAIAHEGGAKIGDIDGPQFAVYGWGDVANYQASRELVEDDQEVIRVLRRYGRGPTRVFYVVTFDVKTEQILNNAALVGGPGDDQYSDLPSTPWRD
jgi:hypothetical protein